MVNGGRELFSEIRFPPNYIPSMCLFCNVLGLGIYILYIYYLYSLRSIRCQSVLKSIVTRGYCRLGKLYDSRRKRGRKSLISESSLIVQRPSEKGIRRRGDRTTCSTTTAVAAPLWRCYRLVYYIIIIINIVKKKKHKNHTLYVFNKYVIELIGKGCLLWATRTL